MLRQAQRERRRAELKRREQDEQAQHAVNEQSGEGGCKRRPAVDACVLRACLHRAWHDLPHGWLASRFALVAGSNHATNTSHSSQTLAQLQNQDRVLCYSQSRVLR